MVKEQEFEGGSEEDALREASRTLGVSAEELDYTVVDEGAEGVFGLGARPTRIRVSPAKVAADPQEQVVEDGAEASSGYGASPAPEKAEKALEVTREMLGLMGVGGEVSVSDEDERIVVKVTDSAGSSEIADVFGKSRPPLGPSFQFIINKVVNRFPEDRKHIVVDAPEGLRRDRGQERRRGAGAVRGKDEAFDPELVALAQMLGERAVATKRIITVHPMHSGDRRAVHQTLMSMDGVRTLSAGEGLYRRMHIVPKEGGEASGRRRRRRRGGDRDDVGPAGGEQGD